VNGKIQQKWHIVLVPRFSIAACAGGSEPPAQLVERGDSGALK
jgi:hypothetical protein